MKIKQTIGMVLIVLSVIAILGALCGWTEETCTFKEALPVFAFSAVGAVIGWLCGYEEE